VRVQETERKRQRKSRQKSLFLRKRDIYPWFVQSPPTLSCSITSVLTPGVCVCCARTLCVCVYVVCVYFVHICCVCVHECVLTPGVGVYVVHICCVCVGKSCVCACCAYVVCVCVWVCFET